MPDTMFLKYFKNICKLKFNHSKNTMIYTKIDPIFEMWTLAHGPICYHQ